jgi:hypothetical protein
MGTEMEIALVFLAALLWVTATLSILSAIDRTERKARRQQKRAERSGHRRVQYRPAVSGPEPGKPGSQPRRLRPH